jgi:hypothetical protein
MTDDVKAVAKAAEEAARTAGKAIDASSGVGRFLVRVFGPALEEYGASLHDWMRTRRAENLLKLEQRYEALRQKRGAVWKPAELPIKFSAPLLEAASLEDEPELREMFAALLVNTTDPNSHIERRRGFITILQEMTPLDARVLVALSKAPDANQQMYPSKTVYTAKLPDGFLPPDHNAQGGPLILPPRDVAVSLFNLARLGCVEPAGVWDGAVSIALVTLTDLGSAVLEACALD